MNNKGFSLVELLAVIAIIGIAFGIIFYLIKGTVATSLTQIDEVTNNAIYEAARGYALEEEKIFNEEGYACVAIQELIDSGYLRVSDYADKKIKIIKNKRTKVIEEIKYVLTCD